MCYMYMYILHIHVYISVIHYPAEIAELGRISILYVCISTLCLEMLYYIPYIYIYVYVRVYLHYIYIYIYIYTI